MPNLNKQTELQPGHSLYSMVKGGFVSQGTFLAHWCLSNGIKPGVARMYLLGLRNGKVAKAWRVRLAIAAGVLTESKL